MAEEMDRCAHRLRSLEIIGGFLDGQTFNLVDGLNCVIGARGTGKTTVLEFVRYAMDAMPGEREARKRIESLVEQNLSGGRLQLTVETKDGLTYLISRSADEVPMVLTEDGSPTELSLRSGGLFRVDVYSQNEVESIADEASSQLDLIDNFESERIEGINQKIRSTKADLAANANSIMPLQGKLDALKEELNQLSGVDEKLKAYGSEGGADSDAINKAHDLKALRDREIRAVAASKELLADTSHKLEKFAKILAIRSEPIVVDDILEGPNANILTELVEGLRSCGSEVEKHLNKAVARIGIEQDRLITIESRLNTAHQEQELKFRELIEKHKEAQGKAAERAQLEKRRNELLSKKREQDKVNDRLSELQTARVVLTQRLSELRDDRFAVRKEIVGRISNNLAPSIRVSIEQYGNPDQYRSLLEEGLKNAGLHRNRVAQKIANAFWPAELSEVVKRRDAEPLREKAELNSAQAHKVMEALLGGGVLFELETVELTDLPKIELNDHGTHKETSALSTGQKCNTILPILLMESENPLLIDQPEDNLDNSFVYETVVSSIRRVKAKRQLVFVTHNPNIPVLGEADQLFVLDSDGLSARIKNEGSVDHCKEDIVTLLEGGEAAFKKRGVRYAY